MSTGLGYMVGPPLGGWLFSIGGFRTPFLLLGVLLLPAAALIHQRVPPELCRQEAREQRGGGGGTPTRDTPTRHARATRPRDTPARHVRDTRARHVRVASRQALEKHEDGERDVPLGDLLRNPQILLIAVASVLANSDYAFLEPTLGDHAKALGIATTYP